MKQNIKIAKELIKLAKSLVADENFNFINNKDYGIENIIEVAKSDVYAHQITKDDIEKLENMTSREGDYDDSYKVEGNWICTAKVGADAGEFWVVKEAKFKKNYETKKCDNETLNKKVFGLDITFEHHLAAGEATFNCFRLPLDAPKQMYLGGNKFVPGDYVFIENGECDVWARSASFMQQQYHKIGDSKVHANDKIKKQYQQLLSGEKD